MQSDLGLTRTRTRQQRRLCAALSKVQGGCSPCMERAHSCTLCRNGILYCDSFGELNSSQNVYKASGGCSKDEVGTLVESISLTSKLKQGSIGSRYSVEEEKLICNKLWEIVSILQELGEARNTVKKLRNHPIHDFTDFLKGFVFEGNVRVGELELLAKDIQEIADDFKHSRNAWVKERTSTAMRLMNDLINNKF